jgi:hypothetical protein
MWDEVDDTTSEDQRHVVRVLDRIVPKHGQVRGGQEATRAELV